MELSVEELVDAGLYDPAAPDAVERLRLLRVLERRGGTLELMVQADEVGRLPRLSAELLVHGAVERLTAAEVATAAGVSTERFATLWRVAGFREPDTDDRRFTTAQVELVHLIELAAGVFGDEGALQLLRVVGASASRIAEAAVSTFVTTIGAEVDQRDPTGDSLAEANEAAMSLLPAMEAAMSGLLRQHLINAARTSIDSSTRGFDTVTAAVGFVDVIGSTGLTALLPAEDIGRAIARFEDRAADIVTGHDGRVVKFIGDEVMYRAESPADACRIALELVAGFADDPVLPGVRGAVAFGELLARDGDYFGSTVNLAARATKLAPPGGVVVTEAVAAAVSPTDELDFEPLPPRALKGFEDPVTLVSVRARR